MNALLKAGLIGAIPAAAVATAVNYAATDNSMEGDDGISQPLTQFATAGVAVAALSSAALIRSLPVPAAVGLAGAAGGAVLGVNAGVYARAFQG